MLIDPQRVHMVRTLPTHGLNEVKLLPQKIGSCMQRLDPVWIVLRRGDRNHGCYAGLFNQVQLMNRVPHSINDSLALLETHCLHFHLPALDSPLTFLAPSDANPTTFDCQTAPKIKHCRGELSHVLFAWIPVYPEGEEVEAPAPRLMPRRDPHPQRKVRRSTNVSGYN